MPDLTAKEHEALAMLLDELEADPEDGVTMVLIDHDDVREAMVAGLRKMVGE